jgi:hypothetical protein
MISKNCRNLFFAKSEYQAYSCDNPEARSDLEFIISVESQQVQLTTPTRLWVMDIPSAEMKSCFVVVKVRSSKAEWWSKRNASRK